MSGGGDWYVVTGLNRKDGVLVSVSVIGRFCATLPIEEVMDYRAPEAGDAEKVKAVKKLPPLVNFLAPGCVEMTTAEWKQKARNESNFVATFNAQGDYVFGGKGCTYRLRTLSPRGFVGARIPVFLTDAKVVEAPAAVVAAEPVAFSRVDEPATDDRPGYQPRERTKFDDLKDTLRAGVQVVSAPQLFPTPKELARRMVSMACISASDTVLEPSAGTGNICNAVMGNELRQRLTAVEINHNLAAALRRNKLLPGVEVVEGDFLEQNNSLGTFDAILMNPPFENGSDIKHIRHARTFLKPSGVLVAICANGPRQREALMDECEHWEDLPIGTFAESGTNVNTALVVFRG